MRRPRDWRGSAAPKHSGDGTPVALHGRREATVIYHNLPQILANAQGWPAAFLESGLSTDEAMVKLALEVDRAMRERAPAGWKGDQAREAQVLNALFPLLDRNRDATQALFELLKNQPGYQ